jgi:hypothetical protein
MMSVYFLRAVSSGWIKIGYSKRPLDRIAGSNTFCPHELKLLKVIEGERDVECGQQFPPSGDCHTPLPCEVRNGNDTTPRA